MVMLASVTPGTRGGVGGTHSPQASRAPKRIPRGAALQPATCPPPPRACAFVSSRQLPSRRVPHGSPTNTAGPCTMSLVFSGLCAKPHVPAPWVTGWCRTVPAPQSPCDQVSCRCAARHPALSMRASQWPRGRLGPRCPGRRRSQLPLPVTHVPPCATPQCPRRQEGSGRGRCVGTEARAGPTQTGSRPGCWGAGARGRLSAAAHSSDGSGGRLAT